MCNDLWGAGGLCQPLLWSQEKGCSAQWDQGWAWTPQQAPQVAPRARFPQSRPSMINPSPGQESLQVPDPGPS